MIRFLQDYADRQFALRPDADAIVLDGERWTYRELYLWSNRLCHALQAFGCGRNDRVILAVSKTPMAIASILGILKAGCVYIPIDIEGPVERTQRIVASADPRLILCDERGRNLLRAVQLRSQAQSAVPVLSLDAFDLRTLSADPVSCETEPGDPAYILYTSGSTGIPKGVVITHHNLRHFINWAVDTFRMNSEDRLSGHPPLHFDLSGLDIFCSFAAGAALHIVPNALNLNATAMAGFIRDSMLTQWFSVPSVLNFMAKFDAIRRNDFPALKRVLWCGEVLPTPTLRYWMDRLPHVQFTNLYGPTETTIASSYYTIPAIPDPDQTIPIGVPCAGEELLVLDEARNPSPPGEIGNLYIGGVGLSPGYWRDTDATRSAFLRHPMSEGRIYKTGDLAKIDDNGIVYFAGRTDSQIKCRGYRIELGEIELALHRIDDLREVAVVAIPSAGFQGSLICCAYSHSPEVQMTPLRLKDLLRPRLPGYMLPSKWIAMTELPRNANGKIDRPLIREMFQQSTSLVGVGMHA